MLLEFKLDLKGQLFSEKLKDLPETAEAVEAERSSLLLPSVRQTPDTPSPTFSIKQFDGFFLLHPSCLVVSPLFYVYTLHLQVVMKHFQYKCAVSPCDEFFSQTY